MRSRYDVIQESDQKNLMGEYYPDVLTFPQNRFIYNYPVKEVIISQQLKDRFYLLSYTQYGIVEYDDIILWLNKKGSVYELEIGEMIIVPDRRDIETFLVENRIKKRKRSR